MWTLAFWKAVTERAVKTAAQSVVLFWGVGDAMLNAWTIDLKSTAGVAAGGFVLSVVTSLASGLVGSNGPSLSTEKVAP